mgnify:CR=1 FL=1
MAQPVRIAVVGAGYALSDLPFLPLTLAPGFGQLGSLDRSLGRGAVS